MKTSILALIISVFLFTNVDINAQISLPPFWNIDTTWAKPKIDPSALQIQNYPENDEYLWFDCPPNTIFGQELVLIEGIYGIFSFAYIEEGTGDTIPGSLVIDNFYDLNSPASRISFWGLLFNPDGLYDQPVSLDFMIALWDQEYGPFEEPDQWLSVTATGQPFLIGDPEDGLPIYHFEADLPLSINSNEGLISIMQLANEDMPFLFVWLATPIGDQISFVYGFDLFNNFIGDFIPVDFAYCLLTPEAIPINNWALFLGICLIIAFTVFRFRRYSA